jgi:ubiquinone/menaquinone biosynthesis C-methylase UbiE
MNNKQWDEYHKTVLNDPDADKDLIKFLKRFYHADKESKNVLDMGCGQSGNTPYMSYTYKNWICRACDFSWKALCVLNNKMLGRENVLLKQCDAKETGYKNELFDLVIDVVMLASVDDAESVIKEMHRILKPKGRVFIKEISDDECNNDNKYLRRGNDVIRYNEDKLIKLLNDNGFEKIETKRTRIKHQNIEHIVCIGRKV